MLSDYSLLRMTEKQENILKAALQLFAQEGFSATSTSKVAKAAGVSEGLIFKHFGNKEGLLAAIMDEGKQSVKVKMAEVVMASEPKDVIRKMLELPFNIDSSEYEMWRLIYALKWQTDKYDSSWANPVRLVLTDAFTKLGYQNPKVETDLLFMLMDGAATTLLLHTPENKNEILIALKKKYQL